MTRLAIIGAGVSGLATAWALRTTPIGVTVFEKSRGYSGRAATRRRDGLCYDHGANYFKTPTSELEVLIHEQLPNEDLVAIDSDVWTFDAAGRLQPGDSAANAVPKWTYRRGINTLGKLLAAEAGAEVRLRTRVGRMVRQDAGWALFDVDDTPLGRFDAVVLTPPAPQTCALLEASTGADGLQTELCNGLRKVHYVSQFTVVLGFDRRLPRPGDFYALLNSDRGHDVAWLSFEEDKPGHVPDGQSVLVVQMAPAWTDAHFEAEAASLTARVASHASVLLGTDCTAPAWLDHQRWRYAQPTAAAAHKPLRKAESAGLFVAGDALIGTGRVHRALETGFRCAERVAARYA